jgi:hypothetical protein
LNVIVELSMCASLDCVAFAHDLKSLKVGVIKSIVIEMSEESSTLSDHATVATDVIHILLCFLPLRVKPG